MIFSFRPTCFGARPRTPGRVPVHQVELKTERVAIAYRLLPACTFVRLESEQNSSHRQIDCDPGRRQSKLAIIEISAQADIDAAFRARVPFPRIECRWASNQFLSVSIERVHDADARGIGEQQRPPHERAVDPNVILGHARGGETFLEAPVHRAAIEREDVR
jgi:hypothetical protein